jgi:hypothetical protein
MSILDFSTLTKAELDGVLRRDLTNLLNSYGDQADILAELIQNAVDAIAASGRSGGQVTVIIGRRSGNEPHYVYVQDDGVGMEAALVDKVFNPGFSLNKKLGTTLGNKGAGLSYVVAASKQLALKTFDSSGAAVERTIRHTYDWVSDEQKPRPQEEQSFNAADVVQQEASAMSRGTGVYFELHDGSNPSSLSNTVLVQGRDIVDELKSWAAYLAASTPVGLALAPGASPQLDMKVRIVLDRGGGQTHEETFSRSSFGLTSGLAVPPGTDRTIGYPLPNLVSLTGRDMRDIEKLTTLQVASLTDTLKAIWRTWTAQEVLDAFDQRRGEQALSPEERALLSAHLDWVHGYLGYSVDQLDECREALGFPKSNNPYGHGAQLIVDGVPQGRLVSIELTSDTGLVRQARVAVALTGIELDTGRKIISDERLSQVVRDIAKWSIDQLKRPESKALLVSKPVGPSASKLDTWRTNINTRTKVCLIGPVFRDRNLAPPLLVDPSDENEVISLWTALLTSGLVTGYQMRAISGHNTYDALVDIGKEAVTGQAANPGLAPVSTSYAEKKEAVLEFKQDFMDLVKDFESGLKLPNEIDLAICWACPNLIPNTGSLAPTYGKWSHDRVLRGQSYTYRHPGGSHLPVIALENLLAEVAIQSIAAPGGATPSSPGSASAAGRAILDSLMLRDEPQIT